MFRDAARRASLISICGSNASSLTIMIWRHMEATRHGSRRLSRARHNLCPRGECTRNSGWNPETSHE